MCYDWLKHLTEHSNKIRKTSALAVISIYFLVVVCLSPSISKSLSEVTSPEPDSFVIPFNINLEGSQGFVEIQVSISLNMTYPHSILVVKEPVTITGKTALLEESANNISRISVGFQKCFQHPLNYSNGEFQQKDTSIF